jgi:hypothetical protein
MGSVSFKSLRVEERLEWLVSNADKIYDSAWNPGYKVRHARLGSAIFGQTTCGFATKTWPHPTPEQLAESSICGRCINVMWTHFERVADDPDDSRHRFLSARAQLLFETEQS